MIAEFRGPYAYMSNFFMHPVEWDGRSWPSNEHLYQARKISPLHPNALELQEIIRTSGDAYDAKKCGRYLDKKGLTRPDWHVGNEPYKLTVMREAVALKFPARDSLLTQALVETHPQRLVEGNWWGDTFWGVCEGVGKNWLGRLLMSRREQLKFGIFT